MAYTPIGWQTGDTITAEKMNKMDNGWGVQSTQLFSETVTTADNGSGLNMGTFAYSNQIDSASIVVTFNGTDYTCARIDAFDAYFYGGFTQEGPDFSVIPFAIHCLPGEPATNSLFTESAGTYTVAVIAEAIEVSDNFSTAANQCVDTSRMPMLLVHGVTTKAECEEALRTSKRMMYFVRSGSYYFISNYDIRYGTLRFIPEDSTFTVGFSNDVFTVTTF